MQFKVTISGNEREFCFKAESTAEASLWVAIINEHIQASQGFKYLKSAPLTKEFWRQEQISEKQFIEQADTFDVLLFKCGTTGGRLIRTYTNAEFDHAAMVLKFGSDPNEVFFMEATSNQGVSLKRFSGMKQAIGTFYRKVVIRHLEWDRPDSSLDLLEQFINEVQGATYSFNLK